MAFNLRNRSFVKELDFTPDELKFLLKLSADEKRIVKEWIAAGLPRSRHAHEVALGPPDKPGEPAQVAAAIDRHLETGLDEAKVAAAPMSDDAEFLRRVSLDFIGRLPAPTLRLNASP